MDDRRGLDLNEVAIEALSDSENLEKGGLSGSNARMTSSGDVRKEADGSKHASGSNTNVSADTKAETGQTLSSDDSEGGDDDDDEEVQSTPCSQTNIQTPYPGMMFESWDEAKLHYNRYAHQVGFSIKCSTSKNSTIDGQKDKQLFVCNKSGKNEDINQLDVPPVRQRNRSITKKTECKARMRVRRKGKKWHVTYFIEEHNHKLIKKFSLKKYLRSHKGIPKEEKDFVRLLRKVSLSAGRIMRIMVEVYGGLGNVPYDSKDVSNLMSKIDNEHSHKDMSLLLAHFARIKKDDPDFYFNLHTDLADKVDRIFWVDGAAIAAYKNYSDCLSFDTTYMTNMYGMPFAPFVGINRYGQTIQLGCGFLRNENVESFVWLFEEFLEAMGGVQPQNIITDQDAAMRTAILEKFPDCCHRNCRWHIMQNAQPVLGNFMSKHEDLRNELNEIIDYSMSVEEFEGRWADMIAKHNVADNTDLSDLYRIRRTFVPAYFMDRFFPFLQTTARSEGFNAVLKRYIDPHNSLHNFFEQYLKLQEKIDVSEDSVEFKDEDKTVRVWGDFPLEEQALNVYTRPIYLRFHAEIRKVTSYNVQQLDAEKFDVVPIKPSVFGYGRKRYRVDANFDGVNLRLWRVPQETIVVEKMDLPQVPADRKMNNKERQLLRYGTLCNDFTSVAKIACTSEKATAVADKYIAALEKELKAMKASDSGDPGQGSSSRFDHVEDPVYTTTKGCPGEKRKKSGLHLKSSKSVKCTVCGSIHHTAATCPSKLTPGPEQKEIDFFRDMV
nr:protein FAR1-RELATED SEQUENCE 5-like [Lolium perenne]